MRRLVAAPDTAGKTRILFDGDAPRGLAHAGTGLDGVHLWSTDAVPPSIVPDPADPTLAPQPYFPEPGGTRFWVNRIPSQAERRRRAATVDLAAAHAAFLAEAPGMAETHEPDGNGMHTSRTIDYGLILEGAIDLELDDGMVARLVAGDSYVLHAARHNWHPLEDVGCTIAVVLVGASG